MQGASERQTQEERADVAPAIGVLIALGWTLAYVVVWSLIQLGSAIGGQGVGQIAGRWASPVFHGIVQISGVLLLTWLVRVKLNRAPWSGMALPAPQFGRLSLGFLLGVLAILAVCGVEYALGWLHYVRVDIAAHRGLPKAMLFLLALVPSLGVGFTEELAFRGYVFQTFGERTPAWAATVLMGMVFALLHFTLSGFDVGFVVSAALISTNFLVLRFATGSLWFPIGFHAAWDWTQTYCVGVSTTGAPGYDPAVVQVRQSGPALWVGGGQAIEGGLLYMGMIALVLAAALIYAGRVGRTPAWFEPVSPAGDARSPQ